MSSRLPLSIFRVVLIYTVFASLWILLSDKAIDLVFRSREMLILASTIKGWLFVVVTGLLLYGLLVLYQRQQREDAAALQKEQLQRLEAQSLLSSIINTSTDVIFAKDLKGHYLLFNPQAEFLTGKTKEEMLGKDDSALFSPEQMLEVHARDRASIENNQVFTYEEDYYTAQGKVILLTSKGPLRDQAGKVIGVFGISRDISNIRLTSDALKQSEARLRTLLDTLPDLVWLKNPQGIYLACNSTFEHFIGATEAEIVGKTDYDFLAKELADEYRANDLAAINARGAQHGEKWVNFAHDGHRALLSTTMTTVYDAEGDLIGVLGIGHDNTEIKQAQLLLRENEERLRLLIEHAPAALAMFDRQMHYIAVSQRWLNDYQLQDKNIIDKSHYRIFPEIGEDWKAIHRRALAGEVVQNEEDRFERVDGSVQWLRWELRPWWTADGEVGGLVIFTEDITARKYSEEALKRSEQRLRLSTEQAHIAVWEYDLQTRRLRRSTNHDGLYGLAYDPARGMNIFLNMTHPDDRLRFEQMIQPGTQAASFDSSRSDNSTSDIRVIWPDQEVHWLAVTTEVAERDATGQASLVRGCSMDISARKTTEERLRLAAKVFKNTAEGVIVTDSEAKILEVNQAFTEISGYTREEVIGRNPSILKSGRHEESFYRDMWHSLKETGQWRGEIWNRCKDGSIFPTWQNISSVQNADNQVTHYVSVFSDISQLKQSQQKLEHLAHHDALTDLPNRALLNERLEQAIKHADRHKTQFALMMIDLDHFKHVNDSLGHPIGDELLIKIASDLVSGIRGNDTVARIGGDEFVMLLEDIEISENVAISAEKLLAIFSNPISLNHHELQISASIGICLYPADGKETETLLRNADAAMYRAKEQGRNNYQFYTEQLTRNVIERLTLLNSLRHALERGQLHLVYQPQLDLQSLRLIGAEALIRWQHPELGMVSPARFIPLAEESGLIHPIGEWVLRSACMQAANWLQQGLDFGRVAVNIAGPQLQNGKLLGLVKTVLAESGLPPQHLELEVTEGFIMLEAESSIAELNELRDLGIALAIDDFGTGYSSLSYLKKLPIHKLKIDQSFVRDIPNDSNDMAISHAVIAMGRSLGLTVIAEGVESEQQAVFLREADCQQAQGYYFSRPISAQEFETFAGQTSHKQ